MTDGDEFTTLRSWPPTDPHMPQVTFLGQGGAVRVSAIFHSDGSVARVDLNCAHAAENAYARSALEMVLGAVSDYEVRRKAG